MRRVSVAAVLVLAAVAPPAAAVPVNAPAKATTIKVDLSRAYAECTAPNATHDPPLSGGACQPPTPLWTYSFGPKVAAKCSSRPSPAVASACA